MTLHIALTLQKFFESLEDFWFGGNSIPILVNSFHSIHSLLRVDSGGVVSHGEDVIEELSEFVGVKSSRVIAVILGEDLIDVSFELLVADTHQFKYIDKIGTNKDFNALNRSTEIN